MVLFQIYNVGVGSCTPVGSYDDNEAERNLVLSKKILSLITSFLSLSVMAVMLGLLVISGLSLTRSSPLYDELEGARYLDSQVGSSKAVTVWQ